MKASEVLKRRNLSNGQYVEITDIFGDVDYARQCFDGTDKEWEELLADAGPDAHFYLVTLAMPGCMADSVAVYTSSADAVRGYKFWIEQDEEMQEEESE